MQPAALLVVADHRLGLLVVDAQPVADGLRVVVVAPAAGQPADDLLVGDVEQHRLGQRAPGLPERGVERLGLCDRAREAVEHVAAVADRAAHLGHDEVVRDQVAGLDVALHVRAGAAQQAAGDDVLQAAPGGQRLGLGALAGARRAEHHEVGHAISRLRILPVGPFGSSSRNQTWRGYL